LRTKPWSRVAERFSATWMLAFEEGESMNLVAEAAANL
jgi:hypothetical protein